MPYRLSVSEKSVQQFVNALVRTCFLKAHVLVNEQSTNENLQRLQGNLAAFMQQLNAQWIELLIASFEQYIVKIQQILADHEAAQQLLWTQIDNLNKNRPLIVPVGMASTTDEFNRLLEEYKKLTIKINIFNYFIFSLDEMLKNIQQYFSQGVFGQGDHFEYSEAFLKQSTELCPKDEVDILNFFNSFSPIPKQTAQASSSSSYEQRLAKVLEKKAKIAKTMNDAQVNVSQTASSTYLPQYNTDSAQSSSSSSATATIQAPPRVDSLHVGASRATH